MVMLDCRNFYESEIGKFEGAKRLEIAKHLDSFEEIDRLLKGKENDPVLIVSLSSFLS